MFSFDTLFHDLCNAHSIIVSGRDDSWTFSIYSFIVQLDIASYPPIQSYSFVRPACILFLRPLLSLLGSLLPLISPDLAPAIPLVSLACHLLQRRHHCRHILHHCDLVPLHFDHTVGVTANSLAYCAHSFGHGFDSSVR